MAPKPHFLQSQNPQYMAPQPSMTSDSLNPQKQGKSRRQPTFTPRPNPQYMAPQVSTMPSCPAKPPKNKKDDASRLRMEVAHMAEELRRVKEDNLQYQHDQFELRAEVAALKSAVDGIISRENRERVSKGARGTKRLYPVMGPCSAEGIKAWRSGQTEYEVEKWKDADLRTKFTVTKTVNFGQVASMKRVNGLQVEDVVKKLGFAVIEKILNADYFANYSIVESPQKYLAFPNGLLDDIAMAVYAGCGGQLQPIMDANLQIIKFNFALVLRDKMNRLRRKFGCSPTEATSRTHATVPSSKKRKQPNTAPSSGTSIAQRLSSSDSDASEESFESTMSHRTRRTTDERSPTEGISSTRETEGRSRKRKRSESASLSESSLNDNSSDESTTAAGYQNSAVH
uniref:BEN domain-containing protein n=2 Tax=Panagrellus redivivus TaxID=6233 RepID=A0A7E4WB22_PANRE